MSKTGSESIKKSYGFKEELRLKKLLLSSKLAGHQIVFNSLVDEDVVMIDLRNGLNGYFNYPFKLKNAKCTQCGEAADLILCNGQLYAIEQCNGV